MGFFDKKVKKEDSSNIIGTKKIDDEQLDLPPLPKNLGTDFSEQKQPESRNNNNLNSGPQIFSEDERIGQQRGYNDGLLNVDGLRPVQQTPQTTQKAPPDNIINNYKNNQQQEFKPNSSSSINLTSPGTSEDKMLNDNFLFSDDYSNNDTKVLGGEEIITNPEYKEQLQREARLSDPKQFTVARLRPFTKDELNQNEKKIVINLDETIVPSEKVPNKQTFLKEEYNIMRKRGYNYIGFSSFRKIASLINGFPADIKVVDDVSKQQIKINEDLDKEYIELEKNLENLERDLIKLDKLIFEQ